MSQDIFLLLRHDAVRLVIVLAAGFAAALALVWIFRDRLEIYRRYLAVADAGTPPPQGRGDAVYLLMATAAFVLVVLNIFRNLQDFHVDYDTLGGILETFLTGDVSLHIHGGRFFPLAHVDNYIVTLGTGGFRAMKYFLTAHLAACAVLIYLALEGHTVRRRLIVMTLFLVCPPVVAIYSSPIYLERNIILLVLFAIVCLRRAFRGPRAHVGLVALALYAVFVSLYLKEPTVVAVAIVALASAWRTATDQSDGRSGIGALIPLAPVRVPLEFTMLALCGLFAASFFVFGGSMSPPYVERGRIAPLLYLQQSWPDVVFILAFAAIMFARRKFDTYFFVFLAFVPMGFYSIKLLRDFDTFPYLNFGLYMAFLVFLSGLSARRFARAWIVTLILFVPVSWFYAARFHSEVAERAEALTALANLSAGGGRQVVLDLENGHRERGVARYLVLRGKGVEILHIEDADDYCTLAVPDEHCQLVATPPPGAIVLTDRSDTSRPRTLFENGPFTIYESEGG